MYRDYFEYLAAKFIIQATKVVPRRIVPCVLASSLCARNTDICMLWHPEYREKHKLRLLKQKLFLASLTLAKGLIKFRNDIGRFEYVLYGDIKDSLLVIWSMCGKTSPDGSYKTGYVYTEERDGLFVFGLKGSCGEKAKEIKKISFTTKIVFIYFLIKGGVYSFIKSSGRVIDKVLLILEWFNWIFSFEWVVNYYLERQLSEVVEKYKIKKIGCIHEMHSYARIVWSVTDKYDAKGYTVQHAAVTPGKRWMFCYPEERQAGLRLPDIMYVYNQKVAQMLKPIYETTNFFLGCSSRYAHWKDAGRGKNKAKFYLFVTALPEFDNETVIDAISNIIGSAKISFPLVLRLHPQAILSSKARHNINRWLNKGFLEISERTSLKEDSEGAIAVIGMSSTALEEALLLGRPVIQLYNKDYLSYINIDGIQGTIKKEYKKLSPEDLLNISDSEVNYEEMINRFGLNQPVVSYEKLFS